MEETAKRDEAKARFAEESGQKWRDIATSYEAKEKQTQNEAERDKEKLKKVSPEIASVVEVITSKQNKTKEQEEARRSLETLIRQQEEYQKSLKEQEKGRDKGIEL